MALSEFDQKYLNQAQQKEILAATQRYDAAKAVGDQAGMAAANRQAEAVRAAAGYSGGTDGSGYIKTGGATAQLPKVQAVSVPKADTAALEKQLKETLEASKTQAGAAVDAQVDQSVRELQQAQQISAAGFDAQRDRIDLEEAMAKDAQALYAEVRGDRGGIGAAQYDSISNTAAQNRLAVSREQRQLAADTAAKIAQLRAQGEYEKADKALELTQDYLGRLTSLAQWAAEYDLSAAKFQESVSQWRAEYEAEQRKLEGQLQEQSAQQAEAVRKNLAQTGKHCWNWVLCPAPPRWRPWVWTKIRPEAICLWSRRQRQERGVQRVRPPVPGAFPRLPRSRTTPWANMPCIWMPWSLPEIPVLTSRAIIRPMAWRLFRKHPPMSAGDPVWRNRWEGMGSENFWESWKFPSLRILLTAPMQ